MINIRKKIKQNNGTEIAKLWSPLALSMKTNTSGTGVHKNKNNFLHKNMKSNKNINL